MQKLAVLLRVLSEPNRLKTLRLLADGPKCVCELKKDLRIPQNLVSHHLRVLKDANLVQCCPCGKEHHYSNNREELAKLKTSLLAMLPN